MKTGTQRRVFAAAALTAGLLAVGFSLGACGQPAATNGKAPESPPQNATSSAPTGPKQPVVEPLLASTDPLFALRGDVTVRGTEPFWSVTIVAGRNFVYTTPDSAGREFPYRAPTQATGGVALFASRDLTVALREKPCSDGMSDITYPYEASVMLGAAAPLKGCAYPRWTNDLQALIGAIDVCLARLGDAKAPVAWAARDAQGATVRLGFRDARTDCRVALNGEATLTKVSGGESAMKASEEDLIFYRAPSPNPGGQCYEATKALGPRGEDLGWLDTNEGC